MKNEYFFLGCFVVCNTCYTSTFDLKGIFVIDFCVNYICTYFSDNRFRYISYHHENPTRSLDNDDDNGLIFTAEL